jgi:hypothetical protein
MVDDRSAVEAEDNWKDGDWNTDPIPTAEEKPSRVLDSKEQTAALFCVEELGVVPPPDTGWVPRDAKNGETAEDGKQAEWWRNTENRDWIYHSAEDKYFHLPSNSLWERRAMDCADTTEKYTTYFRVDAAALQALSHFALSLDVGLMPLAFKAWVRYMRKTKDRHFGLPAPPSSAGPEGKSSGRREIGGSQDSPKTSKLRENADAPLSAALMSVATTDIPIRSVDPAKALQGGSLAYASEKDAPSFVRPEATEEAEPGKQQANAVEPDALKESGNEDVASLPANENTDPAKLQETQATEDQPLASKNGKGKGLFCLRCFRSSKASKATARPDEKVAAAQSEPAEQSLLVAPNSTSKSDKPSQDVGARDEDKSSPRQTVETMAEHVRPTIDTVERHMRKLDSFLELVKKNPQRLVDHVDRRRQDKTTLGFSFV